MAVERIQIIVSENGTDVTVRKIRQVGEAGAGSASSILLLQKALAVLGSAATLKGLVDLLDTAQNMQNRLNFVSKSADEAAVAFNRLFDVANRSRTSFDATVELYSRMALAAGQLKLSHEDLARVTETLNKATILSGATTKEAESAIIQFSQGLAAGALRGQEMRSVMQQIPYVADLIAAKLGVTRGSLRDLGAQGKVSAKVMIEALLEASQKVDSAFDKTVPTISQQFTVLQNRALKFVIDLNERFQILPKITALVDYLGQHMDFFGRVILAGVLTVGVYTAVAALTTLTAAIAANPIGAIVVGITAATAALVLFSDQIKLSAQSEATLADFGKALWEELVADAKFVREEYKETFDSIGKAFKSVFGEDFEFTIKGMITAFAKGRDFLVGAVKGTIEAIKIAFSNLGPALEAIAVNIFNRFGDLIAKSINGYINTINGFITLLNQIPHPGGSDLPLLGLINFTPLKATQEGQAAGKLMGQAIADGIKNETAGQDLASKLILRSADIAKKRIADEQERAAKLQAGNRDFTTPNVPDTSIKDQRTIAIDEFVNKLKEEAEAYQFVGREQAAHLELIRIEQSLRKKGVDLSAQEKAGILQQLLDVQYLKQRSQLIQEVDGRLEENARAQKIVNDLIASGVGHTDQYITKLRQLKIEALAQNRDVGSGFERGFLSIGDEITNFAKLSEQTVTDAFKGMEDALVDFVKTGKLNFSSLVDSILADLTRLLFRQALSGLLSAAAGGGGILGSIAGAFGGARAGGGPVSPGKTYLVGERGPELFTPEGYGTIAPNGAAPVSPTNVHVHVVNVTDPNEAVAALATPQGEKAVLNVIRRNRHAVRGNIGVG